MARPGRAPFSVRGPRDYASIALERAHGFLHGRLQILQALTCDQLGVTIALPLVIELRAQSDLALRGYDAMEAGAIRQAR